MKKKICHLLVVDASGSMGNKRSEVKGEIREILKTNKADSSVKTHTILTDFSGSQSFNVIVNEPKRKNLDPSLADKYSVRGATALYDAIGKSFALVPDDVDGVIVSIITDGMENDSKEMTAASTKALIEEKTEAGWVITFSGTTQAAAMQARSLGVLSGNTMVYEDSSLGMRSSSTRRSIAKKMYVNSVSTGETINTETLMEDAKKEEI